jgi:hypothetical protein
MIRVKCCLAPAALAVASAVLGAGCVDDYGSLLVIHNQALDESCSTAPDIEAPYLPHGTAAVGPGGGYTLTPLVQSGLTVRGNDINGGIIELKTASVEINPVDSDASRNAVAQLAELRGATRYISGSVSPGGLTSTSFQAIDSSQAAALAAGVQVGQSVEVIARVIVYGRHGGGSVASQPFEYPITLINGGTGGGLVDLGPCAGLPSDFVGASDCFGTGQDGALIQCCTGDGGQLVCPAIGTATP